MSVHYKFKSTLNFDTITFDGLHISVGDLKREIVHQKRLGKITDFDLQIINAQTKEEYQDESILIPKNTTLIVSRVPVCLQVKKGWDTQPENSVSSTSSTKQDNLNMDIFKMQGSEEDKIQAMMIQSTADYDPKTYHRIKGQSQVGEVPATYRCNKCKRGGHWIKNCPFNVGKDHCEIKKNTGIPRSFRDKSLTAQEDESNTPKLVESNPEVPEDLICSICNDLFVDAVMIPCCGSSFCDDCVRTALLESEENECPDCKEKGCSPGSLIPNRFLRNSVNAFKNETGYKVTFKNENSSKTESIKNEEVVETKTTSTLKVEDIQKSEITEETTVKQQPTDEQKLKEIEPLIDTKPKETVSKTKSPTKNQGVEETHQPIKPQIFDNVLCETKITPNICNKESRNSPFRPAQQTVHQENIYENNRIESIHKEPVNDRCLLPTPTNIQPNFHRQIVNDRMENKPIDVTNQNARIHMLRPTYAQIPISSGPMVHLQHSMPTFNNGYPEMIKRPPVCGYIPPGHFQNHHMPQIRPAYVPSSNIVPNAPQNFPTGALASIYQDVAAKVGSGVIDDPLEAFNRIMKEKEKQKEERRRSSDRRRSRTPERQQRSRFRSPTHEWRSGRETFSREKRARSRDGKREVFYERRMGYSNRGSTSPIDKRTRLATHQSSPSKNSYFFNMKEKDAVVADDRRTEHYEPPPPGFEIIQTCNSSLQKEPKHIATQQSQYNTPHVTPKGDIRSNNNHHMNNEDLLLHRKDHSRGPSKGSEKRTQNNRSLTPPTNSRNSKYLHKSRLEENSSLENNGEHSDRNKKGNDIILNKKDHHHHHHNKEKVKHVEGSGENAEGNRKESDGNPIDGKKTHNENESSRDKSHSKDRKKKKKLKAERKKSKKNKKEKRNKSKVLESPSSKPAEKNVSTNEKQKLIKKDDTIVVEIGNKKRKCIEEGGELFDNFNVQNPPKSEVTENGNTPPPSDLKKLESVLELECHDTDFDDLHNQNVCKNKMLSEISKWERDDQPNQSSHSYSKLKESENQNEDSIITNEVIRKAENAIFARAINAIRPVEFKVTIPTDTPEKASSAQRDLRKSSSPGCNRPVKERLGSKVVRKESRVMSLERAHKSRERCYQPDRRQIMQGKDYSKRNDNKSRVGEKGCEKFEYKERKNFKNRGSNDFEIDNNLRKDKCLDFKTNNFRRRSRVTRDCQIMPRNRNDKFYEKKIYGSSEKRNVDSRDDSRMIISFAQKPRRPDNPFRKFDERFQTSSISKFDNKIMKYESSGSASSHSNDDDQREKKRRRDKKLRKRSSSESGSSEKRKHAKIKKNKTVKRKKKSKK